MRIRSIKPEFWRSEDIAALDRDTRLLFIGIWSYVDDNGVGRDVEALIVADLFALDDPSESLAIVSRGLRKLSERGLIVRYTVEGRRYLSVSTWPDHQRIDHPNKDRYPLPTCTDANLARTSREPRENLAPGAVEQRNRGTEEEEQTLVPQAAPEPDRFNEFWMAYPRKDDKVKARTAYKAARKRTTQAAIIAGAQRYAADPNREDGFTKLPTTWLHAGSWTNGPLPDRHSSNKPTPLERGGSTVQMARDMQAAADRGTHNGYTHRKELSQ